MVKLSLYSDDMILYIKNPKDSTWKLLEQINEFSKVTGYSINIWKLVAFLYINYEITLKKPQKPKQPNTLEINVTKEVKEHSFSKNLSKFNQNSPPSISDYLSYLIFLSPLTVLQVVSHHTGLPSARILLDQWARIILPFSNFPPLTPQLVP